MAERATPRTPLVAIVVTMLAVSAFVLTGCGSRNDSKSSDNSASAAWADGFAEP
jgi:hypothetical protein